MFIVRGTQAHYTKRLLRTVSTKPVCCFNFLRVYVLYIDVHVFVRSLACVRIKDCVCVCLCKCESVCVRACVTVRARARVECVCVSALARVVGKTIIR